MIPYSKLKFSSNEINSLVKTLKRGWISEGLITKKFENLFAKKLGVSSRNTLAVSSCTSALEIILKSLKLKKKDQVLIPSLTFVADANAVVNAGAIPIFVDINSKDDLNISMQDLEKKITKKTKVVIIMHYAGFPCDIKKILELKKKYNFFLIEDACHALFSKIKGKNLGVHGDASTFSFYSNKNMTTAEGGMIYVKNKKLLSKLRKFKNHGISRSLAERHNKLPGYDVELVGTNNRLDDIRATLGVSQLKKIDVMNKKRKILAKNYIKLIKQYKLEISIPFLKYYNEPVSYHLFVLLLSSRHKRNRIMKFMIKKKIFLSFHYKPIHDLKYYKKKLTHFKILDSIKDKLISLPMHPYLSFKDQKIIISNLEKALQQTIK
jgi:perosamine synthetase